MNLYQVLSTFPDTMRFKSKLAAVDSSVYTVAEWKTKVHPNGITGYRNYKDPNTGKNVIYGDYCGDVFTEVD